MMLIVRSAYAPNQARSGHLGRATNEPRNLPPVVLSTSQAVL